MPTTASLNSTSLLATSLTTANPASRRDRRWRILVSVVIMAITAMVVVLTRSTGDAEAAGATAVGPPPATRLTDTMFLQVMITVDDSAIAFLVSVQNSSPGLRDLAGQLVESHGGELHDLRTVLASRGVMEDVSLRQNAALLGLVTADDLVTVADAGPAGRDLRAIEILYRHLTESAQIATAQTKDGDTFAVTSLAVRIQKARAAELAALTALPASILG